MAEGGAPTLPISQFLGHTNTKNTEFVNARFSPDFLRHAAVALSIQEDQPFFFITDYGPSRPFPLHNDFR